MIRGVGKPLTVGAGVGVGVTLVDVGVADGCAVGVGQPSQSDRLSPPQPETTSNNGASIAVINLSRMRRVLSGCGRCGKRAKCRRCLGKRVDSP